MSYYLVKYYIALAILHITSNICSAQVDIARFEHLTVNEGLSQSTINCIWQGKRGFLWFGTQDGLNKYDGYNFKYYQHNPLDTTSISSNWIYTVDDDPFGNLWIGTQYGLNKLNRHTDKITRYIHNPDNQYSISENEVFGVLADGRFVWVKTEKALERFDTVTKKFSRFEHPSDFFRSNRSDRGFPLLKDEDGIWVGSATGLHFYNTKLEQFVKSYTHIPGDVKAISDDFITGLAFSPEGNLWVSTKYGLNKFIKKTKSFEHYFHDPTEPGTISSSSINALYFTQDGLLWLATDGGGLNVFDTRTKNVTVYKNQLYVPSSIGYDYLNCIFEDKSHNLWIGTDGSGLDKLDLKPKKFKLYQKSSGTNTIKLSSNVIASVFVPDKTHIFIGTWDDGLNILNRKTNDVVTFSTTSPPDRRIAGDNVHTLMRDSRKLLWIGTRNGISIYDFNTKKVTEFSKYFNFSQLPFLIDNRIYAMTEDRKGNVWVGTKNGLHRFDLKQKTVSNFLSSRDDEFSLLDNTIVALLQDNDGFIWIGTKNGLNRYDYKSNKFFRIGTGANTRSASGDNRYFAISNSYIYELLEDSVDGSIWIGTASGLNKYDKNTGTFRYFTMEDGLPNETIYEIIQDKTGNIWVSTNRGIAVLNRVTNKFRAFDIADGLQGLEFNNGASFRTPGGEIFFGGTNGLNGFVPENIHDNPNIPVVYFTTLEKINSNKKGKINIEDIKEIILDYNDHSLTFNFAALEYTKPHKNSYQYYMDGLNNTWVNIGNRSFQDFGILAPGEYLLKVKGSNNDGIWNENPATLKITVLPPLWKTYWAYMAYAIVIVAIVLGYVRSRTKKLQKDNEALRTKQMAALEIAKQREELALKNKNIMDSINYAKRIQEAMLPSEYLFRKLLPDSFIFYYPRDIVSGDFYWVTERDNKIYIAAVDCTGHGVPGAFMSIIGFDLLRNITKEQGVEVPSQILNLLNLGISETFSKHANESSVKDGMDVSILIIDRNNELLEYAGANNPLYIARKNKIIEVKGNRASIGRIEGSEEIKFDNHFVPYQKNDMLYLFSDGYYDQFGGPLGKKFKSRRFKHLLLTVSSLSLIKQKAFLEDNFRNWKGQLEQVDDILVIGIKL